MQKSRIDVVVNASRFRPMGRGRVVVSRGGRVAVDRLLSVIYCSGRCADLKEIAIPLLSITTSW